MKSGPLLLSSIILLQVIVSCNRYIDTVKKEIKTPVMQGEFLFYPDSNVLVYRSNVGLRADKEVFQPKPFKVKIPKKLKHYTFSSSENFIFYYDDKQVVSIHIDLMNTNSNVEKTYTPSEEQIKEYIQKHASPGDSKFNISSINYLSNRYHQIVNKGSATILLYNIKEQNATTFTNTVSELEFLK